MDNFVWQLSKVNIIRSFAWCVGQHLIFLLNFHLVSHFCIWSPTLVFQEVVNSIISFNGLTIIFIVVTTVSIFTYINYSIYHHSQKFDSRFHYYTNFLSAAKSTTLCVYVLHGLLLACGYSLLADKEYASIFKHCNNSLLNKLCVSEKKVFFLLLGGWTSFILFFRDNVLHSKIIVFPIIHELTLFKVKKSMVQILLAKIKSGCLTTLSFTLIYFMLQSYVVYFLQFYLFLSVEQININSLLSLRQMVLLAMFSTYVITSHELSKLIFHIFFTRHVKFPIVKTDTISLKDALQLSSVPFVQHLAFYDLLMLSERDKDRRNTLFSLSLPGGHPHQWKAVYSPVMNMINLFAEELNKLLAEVGSPSKTKEKKHEVKLLPTGLQIPVTSPVKRNITMSESFCSPRSSNLRDLSIVYSNKEPTSPSAPAIGKVLKPSMLDACSKAVAEAQSNLKKKIQDPAILNYFLVSNTEYKLICVMQNVQLVSWSIDSLSLLACASFTEDKYGVVQQDLTDIIVSILKVKSAIEKLPRNSGLHKIFLFYDKYAKSNLKSTVKRSLYRLTIRFGDYINSLSLPPEAESQMSHFLNFLEN